LHTRGDKITFTPNVGVIYVRQSLEEASVGSADEVKADHISKVRSGYPQEYDDANAIVAPRRYQKKNGVHISALEKLRGVYAEEMKDSKASLVEALQQDVFGDSIDPPVDNETIRDQFVRLTEGAQAKINTQVDVLDDLLSRRTTQRTQRGLASRTLRQLGDISEVSQEEQDEDKALIPTIEQLVGMLGFTRGGTRVFAEAVTKHYLAGTKEHARMLASKHYASLTAEALDALVANLDEAYGIVASTGATPDVKREKRKLTMSMTPAEAEDHFVAAPEIDGSMHERVLGNMDVPFMPWMRGGKAELSMVEQNGKQLVVCRAMSPLMETISERLRAHPYKANKFSTMFEKVKGIEISDNAVSHPAIKMVWGIDFHGLTICYFTSKDKQMNGARTYYARTNVGRYSQLENALKNEEGIDPRTPLLVLVAETDKPNQLDVYENLFGVERRIARKNGVGAL
jgi:hypothetical protein